MSYTTTDVEVTHHAMGGHNVHNSTIFHILHKISSQMSSGPEKWAMCLGVVDICLFLGMFVSELHL